MMSLLNQFGAKITPTLQRQYAESQNWKNGHFENLEHTTMQIGVHKMPGLLYKQLFDKKGRKPAEALPIADFDLTQFIAPSDTPKFIWYGHSAVLMRWNEKTVLIDPMLGPSASPIAAIGVKRFSNNTLDLIDQFPKIDLVLMTHDHYDHLDLASVLKLKSKTKQWFVALGVKRHLIKWGIQASAIQEFDWWNSAQFDGIEFTFTPSRHFSGRGLNDRSKSLWGGWAMIGEKHRLYWSGDGGYGTHFKAIGERFEGFDFGFIECGQYNALWQQIHLYPEEAIQAAFDAKVNVAMPVHWGGFPLALHHWKEPAHRFVAEAKKQRLAYCTPKLGEIQDTKTNELCWWENID